MGRSKLQPLSATFNVSERSFYGLDVGNFIMENANLSKILLVASTFGGLSVTANFSLAGSRFREDYLPPSLFNGLVLNRETDGYYLNLSHCGITALRTSAGEGPFNGMVSALGSQSQVIDLSFNQIAVIAQGTFVGVGCTELLLNNNAILIYERKWDRTIFTVESLSTVGNPSTCAVNLGNDSLDEARSTHCTCAPGFFGGNGTGSLMGYGSTHAFCTR